jgi:CheY-like chemotaxis protein
MVTKTGRLLWVDDDHFMMRPFAHLLNSLGYNNFVLLTGDTAGHDAVNMVRSEQFAVVITDRRMPNVDGFSVAEAVRQADKELGRPLTPVIMVTIGDVIKNKDKNGPTFEWVHDCTNIWEVDVTKRAAELSVTMLVKPVAKETLQGVLQTYVSPSGRSSSTAANEPAVDSACMKAFLKAAFEQINLEKNAHGVSRGITMRANQIEMTAEKGLGFNFWSWYDEPHRAAQRAKNTRFTRCEPPCPPATTADPHARLRIKYLHAGHERRAAPHLAQVQGAVALSSIDPGHSGTTKAGRKRT